MNELFFRLKNNIKVYKNVLTESERKQLLEISKDILKRLESVLDYNQMTI